MESLLESDAGSLLEQGAEALATAMGAMAAAAKSVGVKPGEAPSASQEKAMENAMMTSMLPMMKQKVLSEEKIMQSAKECFSEADTIKEAKTCSRNMDGGDDGEDDDLKEWNDKTKKETLTQIDQALAGMACIKKAETMEQMKGCMK